MKSARPPVTGRYGATCGLAPCAAPVGDLRFFSAAMATVPRCCQTGQAVANCRPNACLTVHAARVGRTRMGHSRARAVATTEGGCASGVSANAAGHAPSLQARLACPCLSTHAAGEALCSRLSVTAVLGHPVTHTAKAPDAHLDYRHEELQMRCPASAECKWGGA
jgi:hypothetical protein